MTWLFSRSNPESKVPDWNLNQIQQMDFAIIFKHSQTCPVSWAADRQVNAFQSRFPDAPLFRLTVQQHRELSNQIAAETGVRHESPQILVFRQGAVVSNASHGDISANYLDGLLS